MSKPIYYSSHHNLANQLLIIDPQNDFCDLPPDYCPNHPLLGKSKPSLPVNGAHADMQRLAKWIQREIANIDDINISLDSHHYYDIAHPVFWRKNNGEDVAPFTQITAEQIRNGAFSPKKEAHLKYVLEYLDTLEKQGRHTLMVWPVHCQVGSWGHGVHVDILAACNQWQAQRQRCVSDIFKGQSPWTEHYSALEAEVPDPSDPDTLLNKAWLNKLDKAEKLIIAGEASSHCVRFTVEHLLQYLPSGKPERLVLLVDAMSPVAGFEASHQEFITQAQNAGVQISTCDALRLRDNALFIK